MKWRPIALAFIVVAAACGREETTNTRIAADVCSPIRSPSRWVASTYSLAGQYGRGTGEEIVDAWGVAALSDGRVVVFDAGNTRILELDQNLTLKQTVGRSGRGPGEFTYQRVGNGDWLTAAGSTYIAVTFNGLQVFESSQFKEYLSRSIFPLSIKRLGITEAGVVFGRDSIERESGRRYLLTSAIDSGAARTLRTDLMPTLPHHEGRPVRGEFVGQAEPLWAASRRCVFLSDGAGDWLVRFDLVAGYSDTLPLPVRQVPALSNADERHRDRMRRTAAGLGISVGNAFTRPTAPSKWNDMVVDPDGFVWMQPWRPRSMRNDPLEAWVVNPATGTVDTVSLPAFPDAFLPDGSYVTLAVDSATLTRYLVKYASVADG